MTFISWTHWINNSGCGAANIWRFSLFCPTHLWFHFSFNILDFSIFIFVVWEDTFNLWEQLHTFPSVLIEISFFSLIIFWLFMFTELLYFVVLVVVVFILIWFVPVIALDLPQVQFWFWPSPQVHFNSCKFFWISEFWLHVHLSSWFLIFWFEPWYELSVMLFLVVILCEKYS